MTWRIIQKWFNAPPWRDAEFITDNRGEKFWLSWSDGNDIAKLRLYHRGLPAGHVNVLEENPQVVLLADIYLFPQYQRRGLGKQMIGIFVKWAKQSEFREIKGGIIPRDGVTFEYLQEWYKRQGFQVKDNSILFRME